MTRFPVAPISSAVSNVGKKSMKTRVTHVGERGCGVVGVMAGKLGDADIVACEK